MDFLCPKVDPAKVRQLIERCAKRLTDGNAKVLSAGRQKIEKPIVDSPCTCQARGECDVCRRYQGER